MAQRELVPRTGSRAGVDGLSPRKRQVLSALLTGQGEKQIAATLQISAHTVHAYVRALHRAFAVSSRTELLSLWIDPERRAQVGRSGARRRGAPGYVGTSTAAHAEPSGAADAYSPYQPGC